jgi:biotin-(acetyl-CoA carboxylase) ligase
VEAGYAQLAGLEVLHGAWAARLEWMGEAVVASTGAGEVAGQVEGVELDGALIIRLPTGEVLRLLAGDVRLRHG